jgi:PEP-CTERM motif
MLLRTASVAALMAFAAPASAAVIFDSLDSATNTSSATNPMAATFTTGSAASGVDVSVLISGSGVGDALPGDTFTVSLSGGIPLADLTYMPLFGPLQSTTGTIGAGFGPVLSSITLPMTSLKSSLTVESFDFSGVSLNADALYWVNIVSEGKENALLNWALTDDVSGAGVATNYQDFNVDGFYLNLNDGPPFLIHDALQMKVDTSSGSAPEPSTWAMMLIGFAGLVAAGIRKAPRQAGA